MVSVGRERDPRLGPAAHAEPAAPFGLPGSAAPLLVLPNLLPLTGFTGRRMAVPGGQPQLDRSTSSTGRTSALGRKPGLIIRSISRMQARSPSLRIGWWTVVSGGSLRQPG